MRGYGRHRHNITADEGHKGHRGALVKEACSLPELHKFKNNFLGYQ